MNIIFYSVVILGLLFFVFVIFCAVVNKKRRVLLKEQEQEHTRGKFAKCPGCGVLNHRNATKCSFCSAPLTPPPSPPPSSAVPDQTPPAVESGQDMPPRSSLPVLPVPARPAPSGAASSVVSSGPADELLKKFPWKYAWPEPSAYTLITVGFLYVAVIVIYGVAVGIYQMGKAGVEQLNEVTRDKASRTISPWDPGDRTQPSAQPGVEPVAVPPGARQVAPAAPAAPIPHGTPTPIPSSTPIALSGEPEEQVRQLLLYLESNNWNLARQAREQIVQAGPVAVPLLIQEITHPDQWVRSHVMTALGRLADPRAVPALVNILRGADIVAAVQAASALGGIRDADSRGALISVLSSPDERLRHAAVDALGRQGMPESVAPVQALQSDPVERVRAAVNTALIRLSEKDAPRP